MQENRREKMFSPTQGEIDRTKSLQKLDDIVENLEALHQDIGMLTMVNSGGVASLTTEYQKIETGGVVVIDEKKNLFTYNESLLQMEISKGGYYSIRINGSVSFGANAELSITLFKNGVQYSPFADVVMHGSGAGKPDTASMIMSLPLVSGDVLDIRAKLDVAGDVTFYGNNSTFEKKTF